MKLRSCFFLFNFFLFWKFVREYFFLVSGSTFGFLKSVLCLYFWQTTTTWIKWSFFIFLFGWIILSVNDNALCIFLFMRFFILVFVANSRNTILLVVDMTHLKRQNSFIFHQIFLIDVWISVRKSCLLLVLLL